MNAALMKRRPLAQIDEPAADFREFIAEAMHMAAITADLGVRYAAIGDDPGLAYSVRKLTAYTKAAISALADLQDMRARDATE